MAAPVKSFQSKLSPQVYQDSRIPLSLFESYATERTSTQGASAVEVSGAKDWNLT